MEPEVGDLKPCGQPSLDQRGLRWLGRIWLGVERLHDTFQIAIQRVKIDINAVAINVNLEIGPGSGVEGFFARFGR